MPAAWAGLPGLGVLLEASVRNAGFRKHHYPPVSLQWRASASASLAQKPAAAWAALKAAPAQRRRITRKQGYCAQYTRRQKPKGSHIAVLEAAAVGSRLLGQIRRGRATIAAVAVPGSQQAPSMALLVAWAACSNQS
jgi:hypothetical protein